MSRKGIGLVLVALLAVAVPAARGSGFLIYEHGAAAQAMAGAFTSIANDPSAIWHNPAGLAWVDGTQVLLGATFIVPVGSVFLPNYPGTPTIKQVSQVFYPPHAYVTHKISDRVTVGLGFCTPFGLGTKWPDPSTFPLRYVGTSNDMKTYFINPTVAFKLTDNLAFGFGLTYIYSEIDINVVQLMGIPDVAEFDVPSELQGHGSSFQWDAGLLYKGKGFSLGANYRSHFDVTYKGNVSLDTSGIPDPYRAAFPTSGTDQFTFRFPDTLTAGVSVNLTKTLLWAFDFDYLFWKRYNSYTIMVTTDAGTQEIPFVTAWKNSYLLRTGLQFQACDKLALRAGVFYDSSPQPATTMDNNLPDAARLGITAGIGYTIGKLSLNVAYQHEHFQQRTDENPYVFGVSPNFWTGTYKLTAHLIGVSLGYKF